MMPGLYNAMQPGRAPQQVMPTPANRPSFMPSGVPGGGQGTPKALLPMTPPQAGNMQSYANYAQQRMSPQYQQPTRPNMSLGSPDFQQAQRNMVMSRLQGMPGR